ncbi:MAG: flagellar assembly protein FliW [Bryobacteraceae bacterium]|nr:flagellar assembly protein FliW [Bryobacteraceae bacterium]MDW8379067.1 flagellar assembly protein FliW [Bryobacterales bacterium]
MQRCFSRRLGWVEFSAESVVEFPEGLPAFEDETQFILIERPETSPILFLQSLKTAGLCFLSVPVEVVDSRYEFTLDSEQENRLGTASRQDLLCLALLTVPDSGPPTANLKAPIVIHRHLRKGYQVILNESPYSFTHPLGPASEEVCS